MKTARDQGKGENAPDFASASAEDERPPAGNVEFEVGRHRVRIEPRIVHARLIGHYDGHEVQRITALVERTAAERGPVYIVADISELGEFTPEARRESAQWIRRNFISALALVGGSPPIRALVSLILRAANLLGGTRYPVRFLQTEAEARAWLDAQRSPTK